MATITYRSPSQGGLTFGSAAPYIKQSAESLNKSLTQAQSAFNTLRQGSIEDRDTNIAEGNQTAIGDIAALQTPDAQSLASDLYSTPGAIESRYGSGVDVNKIRQAYLDNEAKVRSKTTKDFNYQKTLETQAQAPGFDTLTNTLSETPVADLQAMNPDQLTQFYGNLGITDTAKAESMRQAAIQSKLKQADTQFTREQTLLNQEDTKQGQARDAFKVSVANDPRFAVAPGDKRTPVQLDQAKLLLQGEINKNTPNLNAGERKSYIAEMEKSLGLDESTQAKTIWDSMVNKLKPKEKMSTDLFRKELDAKNIPQSVGDTVISEYTKRSGQAGDDAIKKEQDAIDRKLANDIKAQQAKDNTPQAHSDYILKNLDDTDFRYDDAVDAADTSVSDAHIEKVPPYIIGLALIAGTESGKDFSQSRFDDAIAKYKSTTLETDIRNAANAVSSTPTLPGVTGVPGSLANPLIKEAAEAKSSGSPLRNVYEKSLYYQLLNN